MTCYELLTGKLPFESTDALELVHCHIAKIPKPVCEINPEVPQIISDIVMKLMAKNADERYQSVFGLKHDLEPKKIPPVRLENLRSGIHHFIFFIQLLWCSASLKNTGLPG